MRVNLIDVDSKIANLALMKLSAYHKAHGDDVTLGASGKADIAYMSCVFTKNRPKAELLSSACRGAITVMGGSGWDLSVNLPAEVEAMRPDYDLYGIDYGIGYTSRGCIRRCGFCVVPQKEGMIRSVSTVAEIVNPKSKRVVLLDNNFLANPDAEARFQEMEDLDLMVSFTQGLDIRLVDNDNAAWLARLRLSNLSGNRSDIYFAFDHVAIERQVREGVARLGKAGIKPYRIRFFVLCGYDTTFDEDVYRFEVLRELGIDPFVMVYDKGNRRLRAFARWVNRYLYKSCDWSEYTRWNRTKAQADMFEAITPPEA